MLFKTTAEIKKFWPIIGTTKIESLLPFIETAERDYIIPFISQEQYDDLNEAYNSEEEGSGSSMSAEQTVLLYRVQSALAHYLFYLWIPTGQLQIGDNGIRIAVTDTLKTAFEWQIDGLKRSVLKAAGSAMDALLSYMEAHKADYSLWVASEAYTEFKDLFIPTTSLFTKLYAPLGNSRLNFLAIRSSMMMVQDFVIKAELGDDYYEELMAQHLIGDATEEGSGQDGLTPENKKIVGLIQKALAQLTMARAFMELSVTIDDRGIMNFNNAMNKLISNNEMPVMAAMISKLEKSCEADGKAYIQKMKEFLKKNIADYETYAASTAYDSGMTDSSFKTDGLDTVFNFL